MTSSNEASVRSAAPRRRGGGSTVGWVLALLAVGGLGVVFGRWAFVPPAVDTAVAEPASVVVSELTVGTSVPLIVVGAWDFAPFGVGASMGTLTALNVADGDLVEAGQTLFTVDLRPVVAAVGDTPAFRDLAQGATGADVTQLQQFLIDAGFLRGEPDGRFRASTVAAVREWQRELGVARDGVVRAGDLLFTSELPARVRVAEGFAAGSRLHPGDVVLSVLSPEPRFEAMIQNIPGGPVTNPGLPVVVTFDGVEVEAVVAAVREGMGGTVWELRRGDGSPVCGERCELVPMDQAEAVFTSRQITIPSVTGPGLPAAAIWFTPGGDAFVRTPEGQELPVTVLGQGGGQFVLDGVSIGTVVVLAEQQG